MAVKVKVSGVVGATTLNFGEKSIALSGGDQSVDFSTTDKIAKAIDNTNIILTWQVSTDSGANWKPLITTTNQLFITAATPIGAGVTVKRMAKATIDASNQSTDEGIGNAMGPIVSGMKLLNRTYLDGGGLSSEWGALDPDDDGLTGADCATVSKLMKSELELLGVTGAQVKYIYARHASWNGLAQDAPAGAEIEQLNTIPFSPANPTERGLIMWIRFYNNYEACCLFKGKYWMGNFGESRTKAVDVLSATTDYPNVNSGADKLHQAWSYYYKYVNKNVTDSTTGVTFPISAPPAQ